MGLMIGGGGGMVGELVLAKHCVAMMQVVLVLVGVVLLL